MIESKKRDAALGIIGGLAVNVTGSALQVEGLLSFAWGAVGFGLWAWGAMSLAQGKGYSRWWGLLALVTIVGMLVLVLLRDRYRDGGPVDGWPEEQAHSAVRPY